jgi:hypothetical protein
MGPAMMPPIIPLFSAKICVGFILARGMAGFAALTADERSLGLFPTEHEAAAAILRGKP